MINALWKVKFLVTQSIYLFQKFLQYEKKIFTTNPKNWTYINLIVASTSLVAGIYSLIYVGFLLLRAGLLWVVTLLWSIIFFRWGHQGNNLDDDDQMYLKIISAIFFSVSIVYLLISMISTI